MTVGHYYNMTVTDRVIQNTLGGKANIFPAIQNTWQITGTSFLS